MYYNSSMPGPLTHQSMCSLRLQLILERKEHQDKNKGTKKKDHTRETSKLVSLEQKEIWKSLFGLRETKKPMEKFQDLSKLRGQTCYLCDRIGRCLSVTSQEASCRDKAER